MVLSKLKKEYCFNKIVEFISKSAEYDLSKMSSSSVVTFYTAGSMSFRSVIKLYKECNKSVWTIKKLEIKRNDQTLELEYDSIWIDKFKEVERAIDDKILEIDNIKFKKLFPEYDIIEDRDEKLNEILNNNDPSASEIEEHIKVEKHINKINRSKKFRIW